MADDHRADGVVGGAAAGVAHHMGVALGEARVLRGVEARVHACEDQEPARRGQGEVALVEVLGIGGVGGLDFGLDAGHGAALPRCEPPVSTGSRPGSSGRAGRGLWTRQARPWPAIKRGCGQIASRTTSDRQPSESSTMNEWPSGASVPRARVTPSSQSISAATSSPSTHTVSEASGPRSLRSPPSQDPPPGAQFEMDLAAHGLGAGADRAKGPAAAEIAGRRLSEGRSRENGDGERAGQGS